MVYTVIGGSGSGKSAYAEQLACKIAGQKSRYYLATMQVYGEEGKARVARHRKAREGKGFLTVEQTTDVAEVLTEGTDGTLLLECMSNLVANEMFDGEQQKSRAEVVPKLCRDIEVLASRVENLVIVTNNVFEDGICYDAGTMEYIRALADINGWLLTRSDVMTEIVYTIPVALKGEPICLY